MSRALSYTLSSLVEASVTGVAPDDNREYDLKHVITAAISEESRSRRIGSGRHIDDRRVVHSCIEYTEAVGRIPTIPELCAVSHVSDRRLRVAFARIYDIPPSRFFREWALNRAHDLLLAASPEQRSVTNVAMKLGFAHMGRFAGGYKDVFGESRSTTLAQHV